MMSEEETKVDGITSDNLLDYQLLLEKIGKDWKLFLRLVGVHEETIENTCASNPDEDIVQQSYLVFEKHLEEFEMVKWCYIEKALKILERNDLIEEMKTMIGDSDTFNNSEGEDIYKSKSYRFAVIAIHIHPHWESIGLHMKLSRDEIKVIKQENKMLSEKEKCYQCLIKISNKDGEIDICQILKFIKDIETINNKEIIIQNIREDLKMGFAMDEEIERDDQNHLKKCWDFYVISHFSEKESENLEDQVDDLYEEYEKSMCKKITLLRDAGYEETMSLSKFHEKDCVNYVKRYYGNNRFFTFNYDNEGNEDLLDQFRLFLENKDEPQESFMIKNYNLMDHFQFYKLNHFVKDNHFLAKKSSNIMDHIGVTGKNRVIYFIKLSKARNLINLTQDIKDSASYVRMFILLHKKNLLDKISCLVSLIVIPTESKHLIGKIDDICSSCRNFIITEEDFCKFNDEIGDQIWETIEDGIDVDIWEKLLEYDFSQYKYDLSNIFGFMASQKLDFIPSLTKNVANQIENVKVLFNPKQIEISNSTKKRIVLIGSYGSGKTFVARSILKKLVSSSIQNTFTYYINFNASDDLTKDMKKFVESLEHKNSVICENADMSEGSRLINTMQSIKKNHDENATIHLVFDEVPLNDFSETEILEFIKIISQKQFVNAHCMIICQAMSKKRSFTQDGINFNHSFTEQANLLKEKADFNEKKLDVNFRNTLKIAKLAKHTRELLETYSNKFSTEILSSKSTEVVKPAMKKATKEAIQSISTPRTTHVAVEEGSLSEKSNIGLTDSKTSVSSDEDDIAEDNNLLDLAGNLDLQFKSLKQNPIAENNAGGFLESSFTYCQDNAKAMHEIEGPYPVLFFPFDMKETYTDLEKIYLVSLSFKNIVDTKLLKARDSITVIHFEIEMPKILTEASILLSKHFKVSFPNMVFKSFSETQGCEYDNVVIFMSSSEYHMRHYLVEAITRSKNNLFFIVMKEDLETTKSGVVWEIMQKWIDDGSLVRTKYQKDLKYNSMLLDQLEDTYTNNFSLRDTSGYSFGAEFSIKRFLLSFGGNKKSSSKDDDDDEYVDHDESSDDDLLWYDMTGDPCGRCIIFNSVFKGGTHSEAHYEELIKTNEKDTQRLKTVFKWLKFEVIVHQDLTKADMEEKLKLQLQDYNSNCLVIFILANGRNDGFYSSDGILIHSSSATHFFSSSVCKSLLGKPKLFFLQVFQENNDIVKDSDDSDDDFAVFRNHYRKHDVSVPLEIDLPPIEDSGKFLAANADLFEMRAELPTGNGTWEFSEKGSLFINTLCNVFEKRADKMEFNDLVRLQVSRLAEKMSVSRMITVRQNTLRKKIEFQPLTPNFKDFKQALTEAAS